MKLIKISLALTLAFSLNNVFGEITSKEKIIKYYKNAPIINSQEELEKYAIKAGDSEEKCLKKMFSLFKKIFERKENDKISLQKCFDFYIKNQRKAYKLYPNNKIIFIFRNTFPTSHYSMHKILPLLQEYNNFPEIHYMMYSYFNNLITGYRVNKNKEMAINEINKECKIIFGQNFPEKEAVEKITCLRDYWRNLIDDEYLKKTGREGSLTIKVKQSIEEKNKARKLWKEVMKNILNYDPYKNYFDKNVKNIDSEKIKPKK